jgi:hypothetical protein
MANPTAVSFWLDNKRVNGTSIAEDGAAKLVKYGSKFYVVEGKDPGRRSYSRTTLPTKWKKIVSGEIATVPAGESAASIGIPAAALRLPSSVKPQPSDAPPAKQAKVPDSEPTAILHEGSLPSPVDPLNQMIPQVPRVRKEKTGKIQLVAAESMLSPLHTASAEEESAQDTPRKRRTKGPTAAVSEKTSPIALKPNGKHDKSDSPIQSPQSSATAEGETKPQSKPRKPRSKANKEGGQLELETSLLPVQAQEADIAKVQIPAKKPRAPRVVKAKAFPVVSVVDKEHTPKKSVKTKIGTTLSKQGTVTRGKPEALDCMCPYCKHKRKISIDETEIDKLVVVICTGCRQEFVLRIVIATYQVQVAGFI